MWDNIPQSYFVSSYGTHPSVFATVAGGGREVRLALVGVPLEARPTLSHVDLIAGMSSLTR